MGKRSDLDRTAAWDLVQTQSTLVLATTNADGEPWATPLFYLPAGDWQLYWFSSARSRHSQNVRRTGEASAAIHRPTDLWREIRGVQMRGGVEVVRDRALRSAIVQSYVRRFHLGATFSAALRASRLYQFQVNWVRLIDNSSGFGHNAEWRIARPGTGG
jgi:uncharacterized protein